MARVSIIIPTFNRAHLIGRAIDSALAQTYQDLEILVINDGSTDNTREKLATYGNAITYIYQENAGAAAARNTGITIAKGDFINFLDSDDWFFGEKLTAQIAYLDAHARCDIVLCAWQDHWTETGEVKDERLTLQPEDIVKTILLTGNNGLFPPHVALLRRSCLTKVGGFDTSMKMREEQDLWLRLGLAGYRFGYVDEVLCGYEFNSNGKGKERGPKLEQAMGIMLGKVFDDSRTPPHIQELKAQVLATSHVDFALYYLEQQPVHWKAAQKHLDLAFKDIDRNTPWLRPLIDQLAYAVIKLNCSHSDKALAQALLQAGNQQPWLRDEIMARTHLIHAHSAYTHKNYRAAVTHLLQGAAQDVGQLHEKGTLTLLAKSLLKLPQSSEKR